MIGDHEHTMLRNVFPADERSYRFPPMVPRSDIRYLTCHCRWNLVGGVSPQLTPSVTAACRISSASSTSARCRTPTSRESPSIWRR